jgi:hypothetical protein
MQRLGIDPQKNEQFSGINGAQESYLKMDISKITYQDVWWIHQAVGSVK